MPTGGYVDDFATTEPSYTRRGSGQAVLGELAEFVIEFEDEKHEEMDQLSVFLGAEDDMRYIPLRGSARGDVHRSY